MRFKAILLFVTAVLTCAVAFADTPRQGKNKVTVRGQQQDVYFLPGAGAGQHNKVLFAPGDGGWRGFAIAMAENLQSAGYDVYGIDTRRYLQSFTGSTVLKPAEIASDFRDIANWARQGSGARVLLLGWSEGAGLGLAAAADSQNKKVFDGLITIGMTDQNILAWRYADMFAEIAKILPSEPTFPSSEFVGKVAPLPLFVIASSHDEYISQDATKALFSAAKEPKKFAMIEAKDHKYSGNTDTFFRTLKDALAWIVQQHK
ncbi:MAG TPA: alpha/beta fold hydrolase [Terriglobales bacterium]|nr:alpha/beta fold hydrolase [Terriglobales bacterium]